MGGGWSRFTKQANQGRAYDGSGSAMFAAVVYAAFGVWFAGYMIYAWWLSWQ